VHLASHSRSPPSSSAQPEGRPCSCTQVRRRRAKELAKQKRRTVVQSTFFCHRTKLGLLNRTWTSQRRGGATARETPSFSRLGLSPFSTQRAKPAWRMG
jgi:hypothetical protein